MSIETKLYRILKGFDRDVSVLGKDDKIKYRWSSGTLYYTYYWTGAQLFEVQGSYRGEWTKVTLFFRDYSDTKIRNLAIKRIQWAFDYFDLGTLIFKNNSYFRIFDKITYPLSFEEVFILQSERKQEEPTSLF